ncbi:MAG: hypothetical protein AAGB93_00620 [Planctomycetota bacterium]
MTPAPEWTELADDALQASLDEYGVPASYRPAGGEAVALPSGGIFREVHRTVDPMTGMPVSTVFPVLGVRLSELPRQLGDVVEDDEVVVEGLTWSVVDIVKDGEVGARIELHEADGVAP